MLIDFIITLTIGFIFGELLTRLKVPGGMIVGAMVSVAFYSVITENAIIPSFAKLLAQIIAGAYIGSRITKENLINAKRLWQPILLLMTVFFLFDVGIGVLFYKLGYMDMLTAMLCAIPGGVSDTPLIAIELGADSATVAVVQFNRLIAGLIIFPTMVSKISGKKPTSSPKKNKNSTKIPLDKKSLTITVISATIFGIIGDISGFPAGALVFTMFGIIIINLWVSKTSVPPSSRKFAQLLSGAYVGSGVVMADVIGFTKLFVPIVIIILGYVFISITVGKIMEKVWKMDFAEGMLAATPAGASDMALIAADLGITSGDLVVVQIARLLVALGVLPGLLTLTRDYLMTIM